MTQSSFVTALAAAGILAVGMAAGGVFIGRGVENARVGARSVTVRGVSERQVKADLAVLPLKFAAAGDDLAAVQAEVATALGAVGLYLAQQGYATSEIDLGRFEVTDQYAREYQPSEIRRPLPGRPDRHRAHRERRPRPGHHPLAGRSGPPGRGAAGLQRPLVHFHQTERRAAQDTPRPRPAPAPAREQFARDFGSDLGGIASATPRARSRSWVATIWATSPRRSSSASAW